MRNGMERKRTCHCSYLTDAGDICIRTRSGGPKDEARLGRWRCSTWAWQVATNCNTSGYKLLIEETGKIVISNQVRFDETFFPGRNWQMIDDHLSNLTEMDVVSLDRGDLKWVNYDPSVNLNDFEKVHSGGSSDSYILLSTSDPDLYMGIRRKDFFQS
jgi:hypothetical protein